MSGLYALVVLVWNAANFRDKEQQHSCLILGFNQEEKVGYLQFNPSNLKSSFLILFSFTDHIKTPNFTQRIQISDCPTRRSTVYVRRWVQICWGFWLNGSLNLCYRLKNWIVGILRRWICCFHGCSDGCSQCSEEGRFNWSGGYGGVR